MKRWAALLLVMLGSLVATMAMGEAAVLREGFYLPGSMGDLYGELVMPAAAEAPVPLVILSHGFGGVHGNNRYFVDRFVEAGFAAYSFDFCGGGLASQSEGTMVEMSVLTEAEDLGAVLDYFVDDDRFSAVLLWGESQGGFVSALVAARRPEDVRAVVLQYPAFVLQDDARARQAADGTFPETSKVMGMTIGRIYSEDALSFDIYELLPAFTGPVLILHGDRDVIVPLRYSEQAVKVYEDAELVVLAGQNHGFTGPSRTEAADRAIAFFQENCHN